MDPTPNLNIVIVDENPIRAAILEDGLREAGFTQVIRIAETANLLARVYAIDPDVILIDTWKIPAATYSNRCFR